MMKKEFPALIAMSSLLAVLLVQCVPPSPLSSDPTKNLDSPAGNPSSIQKSEGGAHNLPEGFAYLSSYDQSILIELKYVTNQNFVGQKIDGYRKNRAILTAEACEALQTVQKKLRTRGLGLKIFDAYRPTRAVDHFVRWADQPGVEGQKKEYFPDIKKEDLFKEGFVTTKSGHSRGSAVDLTLVDLSTGKELPMGSSFDFFGARSSVDSDEITKLEKSNRALLANTMTESGFIPYNKEWWHFRLKDEPFPNTYFDFPVM